MVIKMGADGQICDSISYVGTVLRGNTKLKQEDVLIPTSWLTDALISGQLTNAMTGHHPPLWLLFRLLFLQNCVGTLRFELILAVFPCSF